MILGNCRIHVQFWDAERHGNSAGGQHERLGISRKHQKSCPPTSSGSFSAYVRRLRRVNRFVLIVDPQSNSSFIVKRVVEGPVFNKEPVNSTAAIFKTI